MSHTCGVSEYGLIVPSNNLFPKDQIHANPEIIDCQIARCFSEECRQCCTHLFTQVGASQVSLHCLHPALILALLSGLLVCAVLELLQAALKLLQLDFKSVLLIPQLEHLDACSVSPGPQNQKGGQSEKATGRQGVFTKGRGFWGKGGGGAKGRESLGGKGG